MAVPVSQQAIAGSDRLVDCVGIAIAALVPLLLLRPLHNTPFIDDWVYAWSVEHLLATGELRLLEWSSNWNLFQTLWGALFCLPFGFSFTTLRASTWVLSTLGLIAFYGLLRDQGVARRTCLIGVATLGCYPIHLLLSFTFMTDVPFLAVSIFTSAAFLRALRADRNAWMVVAAIFASLACGIRFVGVVLPAAMAGTLLLQAWAGRARPRLSHLALTLSPLLLLACLFATKSAFLVHTADLSLVRDAPATRFAYLRFALPIFPESALRNLSFTATTLGFGLLPLAAALCRRQLARSALSIFGLVALGVGLTLFFELPYSSPLFENATWSLHELGATEALIPGAPVPPSPPAWHWLFTLGSLASFAVLAAAATRATSDGTAPPQGARKLVGGAQTFLALQLAGGFVVTTALWLFYDRYALAYLPPAIALCLLGGWHPKLRIAVPALTMFLGMGAVGIRDHLELSRAYWQSLADLEARGAPLSEIDGGYMYNGWTHYAHPENAPRGPNGELVVPALNAPGGTLRYRVSITAEAGRTVLGSRPYWRRLAPSGSVLLLERSEPTGASRLSDLK